MSSSLDDFNIRLEFNAVGEVSKISYWDQAGCGHEKAVDPGTSVDDVVLYHLKHYRESHRMAPPRTCPYQVEAVHLGIIPYQVETVHLGIMRCVLEPHPEHVKHRFETGS